MDLKFAAIDVGSNGVRLLLSRVMDDGQRLDFKKETLVRMPIRLGEDVFSGRPIAPPTIDVLIDTMRGFRHLIGAYRALRHAACATAAMREAANGAEVSRLIRDAAGIDLQIIDGIREAELVALNAENGSTPSARAQLHIDIGGGSTELTLLVAGNRVDQQSFPIGTLRALKERVAPETWREMKSWLRDIASQQSQLIAVGTGGNINKLFRLSRTREDKPVSFKQLKSIHGMLTSYSLADRIHTLHMRPDRADVIVPAAEIVLSVMKWARITRMLVPQVGLADGLIHMLYKEYREENPAAASVTPQTV